jgi:hypothetical protein
METRPIGALSIYFKEQKDEEKVCVYCVLFDGFGFFNRLFKHRSKKNTRNN